uniref:Apolipoprotein Bb, tandem duplicate 1 n=1 Tax=Gasterosteus aculeatus aculeatus TaxID=481459 RepID=G3P552_GASAC
MNTEKLSLFIQHKITMLQLLYKTLHKYEYIYEAESLNSINGGSPLKNGPMASCTVEIEVPQTCSFIVRTTGCILYQVVDMEAEGTPVFGPAPSSDAFAAEMEKYPLKVVVSGVYDVKLYPEDGETTTILNMKRGIISALAVPLLEEDKNKRMPTIHGKCRTYSTVNAREDIATDISLERDLSTCDKFVPLRDHTSPLALISGTHYPLAQMVRSSQTCNYKFDNEGKHMTSGSCTENHMVIPYSHKGQYGVTNVGKQKLTLVEVSPHNDRVFYHSDIEKGLHMDNVEDKSAVQDKDACLNLLRELATLPDTEGERRAHLFHKLVTIVRGMKAETLSTSIPEALAVSRVLTYQVLAQCGTPECSSTIMQILRTFDSSSAEVDAGVFAMGLVSNPSALLINDMLEMVKYKPSKPIMYALSNIVKRFYKAEGKLIPEIYSVAELMAAYLGDCSGHNENTYLTLRVVGNMAPALISAGPALTSAVIQCVNQPAASLAVQQAAIQVFRLTPVPEEGRKVLMQVLLDSASPTQKRIAAYLVLMKDPKTTEVAQLADALSTEQDTQVKSFVISHITNILSSTEPETRELRQKIRDALQSNEVGRTMDPTKFSRNYKIGSVEGNMIFEGTSYLPKEVMLEMTLEAFGYDIDMMEIGMEGKGFEPTVDALFGKNGFFPSTALKTMYFVSDNMPLGINEILQKMLPGLKKDSMKRQGSQNLIREIGRNLNKLVNELSKAQSPEAMVYLRLLGNELGYLKTNEIQEMIMMALMTKADNTIFAHYIFMDNEFFLPTATGVPLRITVSGTFTPGLKGGLQSEVNFMPSAGIEFVSEIGSFIPEYVNSGLEMHSNFFHESGLKAKISMERDNVKLTIPAPTNPIKLIKMTNTLVGVTGSKVKTMPPMVMDKVDVSECTPFFAGMEYCTALQYTDAFYQETAPYFPLTGDSKFAVELHPNGDVTEYTATVAYELLKEGEEGRQKVDSVKLILRGMLQVQLLVPSINADATITANMKRDEELELELKSEIEVMATNSVQKITVKYGNFTIIFQSNTSNNYMEMYGADLPYIQNFRVPDMPEISLPDTLFLNNEAKAVYYFNNERFTIDIPLLLGGKSTKDLNFPPVFTTPTMSLHDFGLEIPSMEIPIPELVVPESFTLSIPLFGKAEVSTLMKSNLYDMEASMAAGKDVVETPSYSAKFDVTGTSPLEILSIKIEGSGMLATTDSIKAQLKSSLKHTFLDAMISIVEDVTITDKINLKSSSKIEATSPLGLSISLEHNGMTGINTEDIFASSHFEGSLTAGPIYGKTSSLQSFNIFPSRPEANIDSTVKLDSTIGQAQNTIAVTLANGEFSVVSNTNAFEDTLTHLAELSFKDSRLSLKCDVNALALGMKIRNQAETLAGAGEVLMRMETNADHSENRVYSLLTASLDVSGLAVNSVAAMKLLENEATHKATLKMNKDGLTTSGTTILQSPLSLENTFNVNYADMIGNAKCSTTGKVLGTHMSHKTELELVGLAASITNDARFNSQQMRFDHTIRCSIVPFDLNLDAIFNADGDMAMFGKHSAQLYGKYILRAQPLAFGTSHECRASINHQLDSGFVLETTFDNEMNTVLSLQEQRTSLRMKSKMNKHAFNQDMSFYNTAERAGIEVSGTILTNMLNEESTENQPFTIASFLRYDKNTESQIIHFPLIEYLPAFLETIKGVAVHVAEVLQEYIHTEEIRARLKALPQRVSDFVSALNIEGKQRIIELLDFIVNFEIQMPDVDAFFGDLTMNYLPFMPEMTLPEISLDRIVFPTIPRVPVEKLVKSLQLPEFTLPTIPTQITAPCFGKLYGEIKFQTPIYNIKTSAEFQNSTEDKTKPQFSGFITSQATSPSFEILNYKLDSTALIAIPKMNRVVLSETFKFNHAALGVEHQASLTLYGLSVITAPYTADLRNIAFFAMERGMSASLDTTYNHVVDLPVVNIRSEATVTQKAIALQNADTLSLGVDNSGTAKVNDEEGIHKSILQLSLNPSISTLAFSGDTDSTILKMKQQITAESGSLYYLKFNMRNEAEGPVIKNSLVVASGHANLYDITAELKANHHTELFGSVTGVLSNGINIMVRPVEFVFEFENKGNTKVNIFEKLIAKIDLQNDYSATFKPDSQRMNTVLLSRLNQYKMFYNFTVDNNEKEAGIFVAIEDEANLDFLTSPISLPEVDLPFIDFKSPAISDLNVYEQTGLKNILTTTEQSVAVDAKIVYQKSPGAAVVDMMGLIQIPSLGNLLSELSFKSAIINLNVNAGLYAEDDLVFRLGAITASVFEGLRAKLDGTASLTTRRGFKLANSLSLENPHIQGTHDSAVSMSAETFQTAISVATVGKIVLPILSLEANQNLVADNKDKANAVSTMTMKGNLDIPVIEAVGKAEADHSLKLEGCFEYVSMESSTKAKMGGTMLDNYLLLGVLDDEMTLYFNKDGLRSTSKVIADVKLNEGTTKVIGMDLNENVAVEASLNRVYALLKYNGHNEANLFDFHTNGEQIVQATIDLSPPSSMTADIEINLSQPSSLGDLSVFEKTVAEVTALKQKISYNCKFISPLYSTDIATEVECGTPAFKVTLQSSATSVMVLFEYDMDGELIKFPEHVYLFYLACISQH